MNKILAKYVETTSKSPVMILDNQSNLIFSNEYFDKYFSAEDIKKIKAKITHIDSNGFREEEYQIDSYKCNFSNESGDDYYMVCKRISDHMLQLVSFEEYKMHDEEVISKLSQLNIDISNMSRELSKKNIQLKKANAQIEQLLHIDVLTNVKNRRAFYIQLDESIQEYESNQMTFGLIMVDIDLFKIINDKYGHDVGDYVLERFAETLNDSVDSQYNVFRIGGEEFAIIVKHENDKKVIEIAENLRIKVSKTRYENVKENVTASFGIAMYKKKQSRNDLMKAADDMLYKAKHAGRNSVGYNGKILSR